MITAERLREVSVMPFLFPWLALSVIVWSAIESMRPPSPPLDPQVERDPELAERPDRPKLKLRVVK